MDQRTKDLQDLRKLQDLLVRADSLEKQIAGYEARIREGVSDKYVFHHKSAGTNYQKERTEECRRENKKIADRKASLWKLSCILVTVLCIALVVFLYVITRDNSDALMVFIMIAGGSIWVCGAYALVTLIMVKKLRDNNSFSDKQKAWIAEGARMDKEAQERSEKAHEAARAKSFKEQKSEIAETKRILQGTRKELDQCRSAIAVADVLAGDDKNLSVVSFLVKRLESKRANSLQEALLQYDSEKTAQDNRDFYNAMRDLQRQEDAQRQLQESEDRLRQTLHNAEMERQARRAVKELEGIRKDAEDARRYGRS